MWKGQKPPYTTFCLKKYFLESILILFLFALIHTTAAYAKMYEISFVWLLLKHPIRNLGTPEIATLI